MKNLFDNYQYPWEILPNVKNYVEFLLKNMPNDFTILKDGVLVGKNVTISNLSTIIPPTIIGHNTEIRPGAYIRGNVITGNNCVIGNSSELKNCILLENVQVPHFNYVGDSILGNNSHLGAGTVCSNLKSDKSNVVIHADKNINTNLRKMGAILGDNVEIGCNSVLNPGTIIGKNTRVYPLTSLRGVIPNDKIVKSTNKIVEII
ncbi:MAG: UDP-N-acetylglucosamine pyrophosphorylase [Clostridia bacterium]|nr:UDP-N-acetylglucosamine pyrophosphorylase [Clostridia bacterium]